VYLILLLPLLVGGMFFWKDLFFMSIVSVCPGDVVSTGVGVLHVGSVIVERSRAGESFAVSGVTGDGVVHSNVSVAADVVPLAVDASDAEALVWFDRERYLKRLSAAVFSPGDGFAALGRCMSEWVDLSLFDREPVDTVLGYLKAADDDLVAAHCWIKKKRMECLRAFEDFHAGWLKSQNRSWVEPDFDEYSEYRKWCDVKLVVGGIYQFQREYKYGYFKVIDNKLKTGIVLYGGSSGVSDRKGGIYDTDRGCVYLRIAVGDDDLWVADNTVKLLPISSFEHIDAYVESSKYEGVSIPDALRDIFLDMFSAGEGKPKCLPTRDELWRGDWMGDYGKCCGRMLEVTANMLFDIEKSVGYVRWVRDLLKDFYHDELGFDMAAGGKYL
jgi:hypothetical protein